MKETDKTHIPNVTREGWSAKEIIEQGANEESNEVVEKISKGDTMKKDEERRSLVDKRFPPGHFKDPDRPEKGKTDSNI